MSVKGLLCPRCRSPVSLVKATLATGKAVTRKRVCEKGHEFETTEQVTGVHRREKVRTKALALLKRNALDKANPYYLSVNAISEMLKVSRDTLYRIKRGDRAQRQVKAKERKRVTSLISKHRKEQKDDQNPPTQERPGSGS